MNSNLRNFKFLVRETFTSSLLIYIYIHIYVFKTEKITQFYATFCCTAFSFTHICMYIYIYYICTYIYIYIYIYIYNIFIGGEFDILTSGGMAFLYLYVVWLSYKRVAFYFCLFYVILSNHHFCLRLPPSFDWDH